MRFAGSTLIGAAALALAASSAYAADKPKDDVSEPRAGAGGSRVPPP